MAALIIPIFPLPFCGFEGENLRLHIFEPRYKKLVQECAEQNSFFAIPVILDGELQTIGALVQIRKIDKTYADGEMDISCSVLGRIEILEVFTAESPLNYDTALIENLPFTQDEDLELNLRIQDLLSDLYSQNGIPVSWNQKGFSILPYIHKAALTLHQELEMLHLESFKLRQLYLLHHLKSKLISETELNTMKKLIQMNGHYKKFNNQY